MWLQWKVMLPHSELKVNLHLLWVLLAFISLLCHQTVGICSCHCHPTHELQRCVCTVWEVISGIAVTPGSILLFHSSQMQCWGHSRFVSFRV